MIVQENKIRKAQAIREREIARAFLAKSTKTRLLKSTGYLVRFKYAQGLQEMLLLFLNIFNLTYSFSIAIIA
jgi:hypothetical protein